jgi:hypothetical protein
MKNCIFHIPWKPNINQNVAPDIRVVKIRDALRQIGYNVETVWGFGKERRKSIKRVKELIKKGTKFNFLYSESSTIPTLLTEPHHLPTSPFLDFSFLKYCNKQSIPIGLFIRDVHWNSKDFKKYSSIKNYYAKAFHVYDVLMYNKFIDVIYLPNLKMKEKISFLRNNIVSKQLMPGSDDIMSTKVYNSEFLYVGGINPQVYDVSKLISGFKSADAKLILCCRKEDWYTYKDYYIESMNNNVEIIHYNSEEIKKKYFEISYTLLFYKQQDYRDFAIPFKLFEYITYEKPIVSSSKSAASDFIQHHDIGFSLRFNSSDLNEFLNNLPSKTEYFEKVENMKKVKNDNLWTERAKQIVRDLNSV